MNVYKNYIDLLKNILKNFNNNEFDDVIKNILVKIFDEYYMNRNDKIYCLDNLFKKYDISRYNFIKKKYGIVRNCNLIFRFNRYSKKSYVIKLLKNNPYVSLENNESYKSIVNNILKVNNIKNYRKYIRDIYLDKFLLNLEKEDEDYKKDCKEEEDDIEIKILKKICYHPPCMKYISNFNDNYCSNHLNYKFMS